MQYSKETLYVVRMLRRFLYEIILPTQYIKFDGYKGITQDLTTCR